jgi:hypothetical protein
MQQASTPRPVGRPSGDPEQQEQRVERQQMKQRLRNILPTAMTDGRIAIFRLEGRKGRTKKNNGKPVMQILFGSLEKAIAEGGYTDTGDYVKDQLKDKYGDSGRFLWEAQDNRGRTMPEAGEHEVDLSEGTDDEPEEENVDENDNDQSLSDLEPQQPQFFQQAPPPPPFDAAVHARTVREIITEEKKGAESMVTVLMTMMQSQAQQQQLAMQAQMQQAEARRMEEDRRREREEAKEREERKMEMERLRIDSEKREKEESRREERERERRTAEQQMQMQFFQAIFNRPDTTTPMLMKMIESKGDRDGMKDMFSLMSEASKQAMMTQGEGAKHMLAAQAEASKTLVSNVMGIAQQMVSAQVEAGQNEGNDDPMEKMARIFKMIAPAIGALGQGNNSVPQQQQPQQPQRLAQQPNVQQQRTVPPAEWIKGGLYTIMRLETGEIPIQQRWQALKWCADNLPKPMLDAIRSGVEDSVLTIGAQGMDETIMGWVADENHAQFLRDCIADIQRILIGALTQADVKASLEKHAAYQQAKGGAAPAEAPSSAAEQAIPAEVVEADLAQPAPANGKRRAPPPAEAKAEPEAPAAEAPKDQE